MELLLDHGADPNAYVNASGTATWAAKTPELRQLLMSRGGRLDCYDLVWAGEEDEVVRRVAADPREADAGCGGVFTAAATLGKRDLVVRLLAAGARVPPVVTGCRSYLLETRRFLRLLLAGGMNPDLPNWQRATPLHDLCGRDGRGCPRARRAEIAAILLDAGADISARDEEYRSTPLAWAARCNVPDMVELLLARGAPTSLPDDEPWATPMAWALKRGHLRIVAMLRSADAVRSGVDPQSDAEERAMPSMPLRKIFVNLPVRDLKKSMAFFSALGFRYHPQFTDQNAACMIVSDEAFVMLLTEPFFKGFTKRERCDPATHTEALFAVTCENRAEVDDLVNKAIAAGGTHAMDPMDRGFMYVWSFYDLDGHHWEVFWVDPAHVW